MPGRDSKHTAKNCDVESAAAMPDARCQDARPIAPPHGSGASESIIASESGHDHNFAQRWMRADPPEAKARTCSRVAIVVSPGKVVIKAPCAQPSFTAVSLSSPLRRP